MMEFAPPYPKKNYTITIFVDTKDSWILPWTKELKRTLDEFHTVYLCSAKHDIQKGDFNFILGCTGILEKEYLDLNRLNLVVHESALPEGRGWSPLSWQILEGKNSIPVSLFEAREELDSGPVYMKSTIELDGNELLPEIKTKQGKKTLEMILDFLEKWPDIKPEKQKGQPTFYEKRTHEHDMLEVNKSIAENFDHLRIIDNEKYPAWFSHRGREYILKIYPGN